MKLIGVEVWSCRPHSGQTPSGVRDHEDDFTLRGKCWDAAQAAMSKWTGLTEQHRHEIATDVVDEFVRAFSGMAWRTGEAQEGYKLVPIEPTPEM